MANEEGVVVYNNIDVSIVPDLPISMISDILSRLSVEDVAKCRCVCKDWYHLSKDPQFTHLHFTRSSRQKKHSILIWEGAEWEDDEYDISDSDSSIRAGAGGLYLITKREEDEKWNTIALSPEVALVINIKGLIVASCNGLLCIHDYQYETDGPNLVYNPLTKEGLALPEMNFHPDYDKAHGYRCGFEFDPVNNKYKMVLAYQRKCNPDFSYLTMAGAITLGDTSWRTIQFPHDFETNILNTESVFFNGAFHWAIAKRFDGGYNNTDIVTRLEGILLLNISTECFQAIKFSPPLEIPCSCFEQILVDNSLAFVRYTDCEVEPTTLEIWQIQGANPDDSCLYNNWTFSVHIEGCPFVDDLEVFEIQGVFSNRDFLFKVYQNDPMDVLLYHHLVFYDAKKNKGSVIEISGAPTSFNARNFLPSFISPSL